MPPRLTSTRVTSVAEGKGGRPKALNPGSSKAANFKAVKGQLAKRHKVGPDRADEMARG